MNELRSVETIVSRSNGFKPSVGIILGSGLGSFVDKIQDQIVFSYDELDGFPPSGVGGHAGKLVLGTIEGTPVAVLQGRVHYYESGQADAMKVPVRTLAGLGCEQLLLTNAAGSLKEEAQPGSVMLINDHINFTGVNPLFGEDNISRFVDMGDAYDPNLRDVLHSIAADQGIKLHEGVYIWFCGPSFETPAEIRAAKTIGADAVGMSTVPEVILARHAGMNIATISVITNMAAGMSSESLSHEQTMANADIGIQDLQKLLINYLKTVSS
ncbi:MAG TPA: purine-nucleoside phosphorylase [Candidatus Marinimicrobia bacterium]|jgi:purine-nucleoside phosphorylase|nr:purine-nucleoside phosphorylase [Candidatus Neomarinimicrobiota bacterium]MDP6276090.1 purine-nucleoside phosphorylase [Candidatus Neomarinimicrobiota bacterium]HBN45306.1 purine-nucleoside phosphorylase [Candidatus Neomarinimicrobiota bacterium]HJL73709.1 purine-nucleoside phosphorylase [Candidatus Neomarinimicrobiota bacterium]HJM70599.1 purine-nucleoside phosphorylase [Candidatus Neomarinimicrobiota bacterium]|tara:strand:+ start:3515 stop:4321 length:807 start_codon:yes stop_codon:yes gene_type:complete